MSNDQDTLLKEANELLETAQKEVLQEINTKRNLISRLFAGKSVSDSLKQAQSSISKAINQMKNIKKGDTSIVGKLQKHLNEKNVELQKLEESFQSSKKESSELRDKIKFYETEFAKMQSSRDVQVEEEETKVSKEKNHKLEEDLKQKIQDLEDKNRNLGEKYTIKRDELKKSQELAVEFSARMKRLKAEVLNQN